MVAACFLLALGINTAEVQANVVIPGGMFDTVISKPSGYVSAGMLLVVLFAVSITVFAKKRAKMMTRNGDDKDGRNDTGSFSTTVL